MHEVIHVIFNILDIEQEEHTVNLLEAGLYQTLKDNGLFKQDN